MRALQRIIQQLTCLYCGYKWWPKTEVPRICPHCKNPWNQKRKYKKHAGT